MNKTFKRYAMSSLITFVSGFAMSMLAQYDKVTLETVQNGALLGIVFTALRAGFKLVLEYLVQPSRV